MKLSNNLTVLTVVVCSICLYPLQALTDNSNNLPANKVLENPDSEFNNQLRKIQDRWATINYNTDSDHKAKEFEKLSVQAEQFANSFPAHAEPVIWQGIIFSTWAGAEGGFSALSLVKKARTRFEKALSMDETALNGSAYVSLGSLYYQVPGWPISFGSDKKAEQYLRKALTISPDGIDSNYFYADYLIQIEGDYKQAKVYLEKAQQAKNRPFRKLEDEGRRQQIKDRINLVMRNLD